MRTFFKCVIFSLPGFGIPKSYKTHWNIEIFALIYAALKDFSRSPHNLCSNAKLQRNTNQAKPVCEMLRCDL